MQLAHRGFPFWRIITGDQFGEGQLPPVFAARPEHRGAFLADGGLRALEEPGSEAWRRLVRIGFRPALQRQPVAVFQHQQRPRVILLRHQIAALGGDRLRPALAPVVEQENALKPVGLALQLVENEGARAHLHEHPFLGQIEDLDIAHRVNQRPVGVARVGLHPAEDEHRRQRHQDGQPDHRPHHPVQGDSRSQHGVDFAVLRHPVDAEQQAQKQRRGHGDAQIMGHQIAQKLEDHGEGVLLAERHVENAHQPLRKQHHQPDAQRHAQGLEHLGEHITVQYLETGHEHPRKMSSRRARISAP